LQASVHVVLRRKHLRPLAASLRKKYPPVARSVQVLGRAAPGPRGAKRAVWSGHATTSFAGQYGFGLSRRLYLLTHTALGSNHPLHFNPSAHCSV
jgi:hypothetical protein